MIRVAKESDLPALLEMGRNFAAVSGAPISYDEDSAKETLLRLMSSPDSVVLVADQDGVVGMTAGLIYRHYFNAFHVTGNELFWWVEPKRRGGMIALRMFRALEQWAASMGANSFTMAALHTQDLDRLSRFYDKNGYSPLESTYTKVLQ